MESLRSVGTALLALTLVTATAGSAAAQDTAPAAQPPPAAATEPAAPAASASFSTNTNSGGKDSGGKGHGLWQGLLIGGGVAMLGTGIIMAVTAPELPSGCDSSTDKCTRRPNETAAQLEDRQERAGEHEALKTAGYVLVGVGLASITGGIIWALLDSKDSGSAQKERDRGWTARVAPWVGGGGGGIATGGTF